MKKQTTEITVALTLRGEPKAVVAALANGLPADALEGIRDGMQRELEARQRKPSRRRRTAPPIKIDPGTCRAAARDHNDRSVVFQCTLPIGHVGDHRHEPTGRGWLR